MLDAHDYRFHRDRHEREEARELRWWLFALLVLLLQVSIPTLLLWLKWGHFPWPLL